MVCLSPCRSLSEVHETAAPSEETPVHADIHVTDVLAREAPCYS